MPWGKTEEEKQAEAQARHAEAEARAAQEATRARAQAEARYWASPVGQAAQARQRGDRFFQIQIPAATLTGQSSPWWVQGDASTLTGAVGATDLLGQIEELGWRLEHASWIFIETGTSSRERSFIQGEQTMTSGRIDGIYLFRSAQVPEGVDLSIPRVTAQRAG